MAFYVCLLAVLVSEGIVVKCTAAIFFLYGGLETNTKVYEIFVTLF